MVAWTILRRLSTVSGGLLVGILLLPVGRLGAGESACAGGPGFVRTRGRWIVDAKDRVLILRGVNLSGRSKRPPFLPDQTREEIAALREWGFNSVRYLIVWEAVEPKPGQYDDAYLDRVAERVKWCREAGLRVILDMHQDLFSRKYGGDGAPEWACLDDGIAFVENKDAWFVNYSAPAVIRAFDSFWANRGGPGGIGIQDRFISAWQHVACRFRDDANIVGYDVLNEPCYGSDIYAIFLSVAIALGQELDFESQVKALGFLSSAKGAVDFASQTVRLLKQRDALWKVLDRGGEPAQAFERQVLQPFHDRLVAAIRQVDPHHICFFEAAGGPLSSTRFTTGLDRPRDRTGVPFENVVFAPHHYDLSTDLRFPYDGTAESVCQEMRRAVSAADRMGVPTWFGEWGALFESSAEADRLVRDHVDALDSLVCGWAWWDCVGGFGRLSFRPLLGRPHAEIVAGVPSRMRCAPGRLDLEFKPLAQGGETVIWASPALKVQLDVRLPGGLQARTWRTQEGLLHILCPPGAESCSVSGGCAPAGP